MRKSQDTQLASDLENLCILPENSARGHQVQEKELLRLHIFY